MSRRIRLGDVFCTNILKMTARQQSHLICFPAISSYFSLSSNLFHKANVSHPFVVCLTPAYVTYILLQNIYVIRAFMSYYVYVRMYACINTHVGVSWGHSSYSFVHTWAAGRSHTLQVSKNLTLSPDHVSQLLEWTGERLHPWLCRQSLQKLQLWSLTVTGDFRWKLSLSSKKESRVAYCNFSHNHSCKVRLWYVLDHSYFC